MTPPAKKYSRTAQTGSKGQTQVKGMFEDLDWGPIPNTEHDNGTDLFVQVRDADLTELGLLLGVQVKNEKDYDASKLRVGPKGQSGWWYKAKPKDVALWLKHAVPHIIALYDRNSRTAAWEAIDTETVRWTEKGARIFVPQGQLIDPDSTEALLAVAARGRTTPSWSGTTWTDGSEIAPDDRLRTALLTPRILAVHGNRRVERISAEQAIAGLMLCRDDAPDGDGKNHPWTPEAPVREGSDWRWAFFEAIRTYIFEGEADLDALREVLGSAPTKAELVAVAAVLTGFLRERGQLVESVGVLDSVQTPTERVDEAWLATHRAAAEFELGLLDAARRHALDVMTLQASHGSDPTALLLVAAAAEIAFQAGPSSAEELEPTIRAADTPPVWWQTQYRAWGLSYHLDDAFRGWAGKDSANGTAHRASLQYLRAVTLQHAASGNHPAWRQAIAELVRSELASSGDMPQLEDCEEHLRDLILSGNEDAVTWSADRFLRQGPYRAVKQVAEEADLDRCGHSSLPTTIALVRSAAGVIDQSQADRFAKWSLNVISNPEGMTVVQDFPLGTLKKVIEMLADLVPVISPAQLADVRTAVVSQLPVHEQLIASRMADLLRAVPDETWTQQERDCIGERLGDVGPNWNWSATVGEHTSFGDHWAFSNALWTVLSRQNQKYRDQALNEMARGLTSAFIGHRIDELPGATATAAIVSLSQKVNDDINVYLRTGGSQYGDVDPGALLVKLNVFYPQAADWSTILRTISAPAARDHLVAVLRAIVAVSARITPAIATELAGHIRAIDLDQGFFGWPPVDLPSLVQRSLDLLDQSPLTGSFLSGVLTRGVAGKRVAAVRLGRRPQAEHFGLLVALIADEDAAVATNAMWAATRWAIEGIERDNLLPVILQSLTGAGTDRGKAVAAAIYDVDEKDPGLDVLREAVATLPFTTHVD